MKLYTVDRRHALTPGEVYGLVKYDDVQPAVLQSHIDLMFADGLSAHGETYLLKNESRLTAISPMLEMMFEYVRRARFPHLPSRFQCMFAVDTLEAADKFKTDFNCTAAPVYRVESEITIKADMRLLTAQSILVTSYFGELYWSGQPHPEGAPFWEYLLKCPVKVCERVA